MTPRKRETGGAEGSRSELLGAWASQVDGCKGGDLTGGKVLDRVLGPLGNWRRLRLDHHLLLAVADRGKAGRLGTERLMRLPSRMCPLGMGIVAWLLSVGL